MPIDHEDITELKKVFDDRYVLQADCSERQEGINKKFANDDKRIEKLFDKLAIWDKLLWAIATASVGALVVAFLELVLK
ncbi:MAG: hypothetical protein J6S23_08420 [Clostridia bacterium]|nr:hypothetical protein [Clostridia bacterium]